jgi:hypothetical protein
MRLKSPHIPSELTVRCPTLSHDGRIRHEGGGGRWSTAADERLGQVVAPGAADADGIAQCAGHGSISRHITY